MKIAQGILQRLNQLLFRSKTERFLINTKENFTGTLGAHQKRFALIVGLLLLKVYELGYEVSLGDAWARPSDVNSKGKRTHKPWSNHYDRIAIDLNLFKNGKWLKATEAHAELGAYCELLGGCWGGHFDDGNHYSIRHRGVV